MFAIKNIVQKAQIVQLSKFTILEAYVNFQSFPISHQFLGLEYFKPYLK